jgi:hypothetical protein
LRGKRGQADFRANCPVSSKIVATMLANNVEEIITANKKDFEKFFEIKVTDPFLN